MFVGFSPCAWQDFCPQTLTWLNDQSGGSDSAQWVLWVDDQYRVIKMTVAGSGIEVVRD